MKQKRSEIVPVGIGYYSVPEASRLLKIPARNINRWLGGYAHNNHGRLIHIPPLWSPQIPRFGDRIEIGFRDLIELRFVQAFLNAGLGLKSIRRCLDYARECVNDDHPFSTRRFQTDGRTIFLDTIRKSGDEELLDLKKKQYVLKQVIEKSFKDLDIEHDAVARWRPYNGRGSIIIDPARAFGQPIAAECGVPTVVLAEAVESEGSVERVAEIYEAAASVVRDAVKFEESLKAA
ncbi:MAG: hypothetical protein N2444_05495 [Methylocystis sp.]|nr:hypothetical protein [Methylocystis sp.]